MQVLLDENVPPRVAEWLRHVRPTWSVAHVNDIGLQGCDDETVLSWAVQHAAFIISFDEDFADRRLIPREGLIGILRLRVWPTTTEEVISAAQRMLEQLSEEEMMKSLIVIDNAKIRIRRL